MPNNSPLSSPLIGDTANALSPSYGERAKAMLTGSGPIHASTGITFTPEDIDHAIALGTAFSGGGLATKGTSAETMARFFNKLTVPNPVPFLERIWNNYASKMKPHELWDSEAIWGNANRMHKEAGWPEHEAFAYLMNNMLRRMGEDGYVSPEMASEYMAKARLDQVLNEAKAQK